MKLAIVLLALVVAVSVTGCGDSGTGEGSLRGSFESSLQPFDETFEQEWIDLVGECARLNGIQGWNEADPRAGTENITAGPPPGIDQRDHLAEHGSGLIEAHIEMLNRDITNLPAPEHPKPILSEGEAAVLNIGPIVTTQGESFNNGGCRAWATEVLTSRSEFTAKQQLAEDYSEFFVDKAAASPELLSIELKWSQCMANSGFPGLTAQGDQLDVILEKASNLTADSPTEPALALDRAISVAAWDCNVELRDERNAVLDAFVSEFIETRNVDF